jgi:hypothetical protein
VIGCSDDEEAIIPYNTIELVKKERPILVIDQAVKVLEYHNTGRQLSGLVEYFCHSCFFALPAFATVRLVKSQGSDHILWKDLT